jgi:hypothetical protein
MSCRLRSRFLVAVLGSLSSLCGLEPVAHAQPKICGNQPALGGWSLASCPTLRDDDGDGIYSVTVGLSDTPLLEYKILPTGAWDGSTEIRANGTCPADGGAKRNDTQNIQIVAPDTRKPATFFYDGRSLADPSYSPAAGGRSAGDSLMLDAPVGTCPRWLAVGDFQNLPGPNATAVSLAPLRPGVWVGRTTAAKSLPSGWRWRVVEQAAAVAREYGPSGWAYAPCEATPAMVSAPVSAGDTIYFLLHAHGGRMQTVVSATPLDGFSSDGSVTCTPPADLGTAADLAGPPMDLGGDPLPLDGGADGGLMRRPGIHCDCRVGQGPRAPSPPAILSLAAALCWLRLTRRARRSNR